MIRYTTGLLAYCLLVFSGIESGAHAQSGVSPVAGANCSDYTGTKSDTAKQDVFFAYIAGYASATNPNAGVDLPAAALSDSARNVQEWCRQNPGRRFAEGVGVILGTSHVSQNSAPPPASSGPTSCRVGPTDGCSGCSVSCDGGKQATCKQGSDFAKLSDRPAQCAWQAKCFCK
ncbi:hypothetical protein [Acidisarcina polymorpha]|uniref:hypothetical protein n=1 Tax=Acidisarcina polymorpha TaxID=2211140 RepID=UPI000DEFA73D|nr:hypothetical protein [Acidisarcina polymorpha]